MPVLYLVIALNAVAHRDGPPVDASQFGRLIAAAHADVRDVSFVYEGGMRTFPKGTSIDEMLRDDSPAKEKISYQGSYSYRNDGAVLQDWFSTRIKPEGPLERHKTWALLGIQLSRVTRFPERRNEKPEVRPGVSASFYETPQRIYYGWFFQLVQDDPAAWNYEYLGWEEEGGHRCLKVQLDSWTGRPPEPGRPYLRFWIDMERGSHPLRVDYGDGRGARMRAVGIELERLPLDREKEIWFPVRGRVELNMSGFEYVTRPVGIETYYVLDGTVRFNQGLKDSYFSLDTKGLPESPALARQRKEFRKPPLRFDPEGIREGLDRRLAKAEAQALQLQASSPAAEVRQRTRTFQIGIALIGVALLGGAAYWRWRTG